MQIEVIPTDFEQLHHTSCIMTVVNDVGDHNNTQIMELGSQNIPQENLDQTSLPSLLLMSPLRP